MKLAWIQPHTPVDYPGKSACVVFTPGCNFRCPFCYNPETVLPDLIKQNAHDYIPQENFFNFLNKRKWLLDGVSICGGEPTLQPDLLDFARQIKQMGFLVKLDTNGSNFKIVEQMIGEWLLDYVAVDMKYPINKYNRASGIPTTTKFTESYSRLLQLLKSSAIPFEYRTTLIKGFHTKKLVQQMAEYLQWIPNYYLQNFMPGTTLDPGFTGKSFEEEEMEEMRDVVEEFVGKCGLR